MCWQKSCKPSAESRVRWEISRDVRGALKRCCVNTPRTSLLSWRRLPACREIRLMLWGETTIIIAMIWHVTHSFRPYHTDHNTLLNACARITAELKKSQARVASWLPMEQKSGVRHVFALALGLVSYLRIVSGKTIILLFYRNQLNGKKASIHEWLARSFRG